MAHFARLSGNTVTWVTVVKNEDIGDAAYPESEARGLAFLRDCGIDGTFVQCSYTAAFRGAYPGEGWTFDPAADVFLPPVIGETQP